MYSARRKGAYCPKRLVLGLADLTTAVAAPFLALYFRDLFEFGSPGGGAFLVYGLSSAVGSVLLLWSLGCLSANWRYFSWSDASRVLQAVSLGVAIGAVCGFADDRLKGVARAVPFLQVLIHVAAFTGIRIVLQKIRVSEPGAAKASRHVLVVGCNKAALTYLNAVRELSNGSIEAVGLLAEDSKMVGQTVRGKRVRGVIGDIEEEIATLQVHGVDVSQIAVAARLSPDDNLVVEAAIKRYALSRVDIDAVLAAFAIAADEPLKQPATLPWKPLYALVKRSIDLCGASALLVLTAPMMLLLCPIVALDIGFPILFWQQRLGKDGKRLMVYKFRTMRAPLDSTGRRIPDAHRISIVGHTMRKLRLDELPQLLSILKGDMSFVGPRPLLPIDQPTDSARRLSVKPGLTGWAQVHGGNLVAIEDKNALDLWYVAHSSLRLDIEIALRTVWMILQGDNIDSRRIEQAKSWMTGFDYAGT